MTVSGPQPDAVQQQQAKRGSTTNCLVAGIAREVFTAESTGAEDKTARRRQLRLLNIRGQLYQLIVTGRIRG